MDNLANRDPRYKFGVYFIRSGPTKVNSNNFAEYKFSIGCPYPRHQSPIRNAISELPVYQGDARNLANSDSIFAEFICRTSEGYQEADTDYGARFSLPTWYRLRKGGDRLVLPTINPANTTGVCAGIVNAFVWAGSVRTLCAQAIGAFGPGTATRPTGLTNGRLCRQVPEAGDRPEASFQPARFAYNLFGTANTDSRPWFGKHVLRGGAPSVSGL